MSGRVVVVGSSNTDLVVRCGRLPLPGETVMGGDLLSFAGGKGANQAVAAARAGAKARFIGAFGDDAFGAARRADLERESVDCSGCVVKKGRASGVALIAIGAGGGAGAENLIVVAPGANRRLTANEVRRGLPRLTPQDVVLCSLEVPFPAVTAALRAARRARAWSILNPAPFPARGVPRGLLRLARMLTPNETEFAGWAGRGGRGGLVGLLRRIRAACAYCVVTCGARGVRVYPLAPTVGGAPRPWRVAAPKVKPVDTVGAGDCFNGALAAYLAECPGDVPGAVRFAVAAAALKVARHGAQAGLPRRAEILRAAQRWRCIARTPSGA